MFYKSISNIVPAGTVLHRETVVSTSQVFWVWLGRACDPQYGTQIRCEYTVTKETLRPTKEETVSFIESQIKELLLQAGAKENWIFQFKIAPSFLVNLKDPDGYTSYEQNVWPVEEMFPELANLLNQ